MNGALRSPETNSADIDPYSIAGTGGESIELEEPPEFRVGYIIIIFLLDQS